jgi:helicase MOV-10
LGRLMDTVDLYQRKDDKFNPLVLTKLVANFRSHPAILKVPNELFYESDLVVINSISVFSSVVY